jgi:hypothetical protein
MGGMHSLGPEGLSGLSIEPLNLGGAS